MDIQWDESKTLSHTINYPPSCYVFEVKSWRFECLPSIKANPTDLPFDEGIATPVFISDERRLLYPLTLQDGNNLRVFNCSPTKRNRQSSNPLIQ